MLYTHHNTPIGQLMLAGDEETLKIIEFPSGKRSPGPQAGWRESRDRFVDAKAQLDEYFHGERTEFSVPLGPHGTSFQLSVLCALQQIPYGETRSYGEIAQTIGRPKAARAVGAANGRNPIPIIIPCHRVIGSGGDLVGFGGGLTTKQFLLNLEGGGKGGPLF